MRTAEHIRFLGKSKSEAVQEAREFLNAIDAISIFLVRARNKRLTGSHSITQGRPCFDVQSAS
jgi:hypothetical protein